MSTEGCRFRGCERTRGIITGFGVRRSAFGVRRSAFGVRGSRFEIRRSRFEVRVLGFWGSGSGVLVLVLVLEFGTTKFTKTHEDHQGNQCSSSCSAQKMSRELRGLLKRD